MTTRENAAPVFAAAILLAVPLGLFAWWIRASSGADSQSAAVGHFLAPFPDYLKSARLLTWLAIAFSIAALLLALRMTSRQSGVMRWLQRGIVAVAAVSAMWNLFTLM